MGYTASMHYFGICTPDDIHAKRGYPRAHRDELLVGVLAKEAPTITEMREGVLWEIYALDFNLPDGLTSAAIEAALTKVLPAAPGLFDAGLEDPGENGEPRVAWWSLQWMEWPAREA